MTSQLTGTSTESFTYVDEFSPHIARAFSDYEGIAGKQAATVLGGRLAGLVSMAVALASSDHPGARTHLSAARDAGATDGDVADAVMAAAGLQCGASVAYGRLAYKFTALGNPNESGSQDAGIEVRGDRARMADLRRSGPDSFRGLIEFMQTMHDETKMTLSTREYEAIATAVGITEHCIYCIDTHANAMLEAGGTREELGALVHLVSTGRARGLLTEANAILSDGEEAATGVDDVAVASLDIVVRSRPRHG